MAESVEEKRNMICWHDLADSCRPTVVGCLHHLWRHPMSTSGEHSLPQVDYLQVLVVLTGAIPERLRLSTETYYLIAY